MAKAASRPELRAGFNEHLEQTRGHVTRLERICEQLGVTPKGEKCAATEGLVEEGKELMEEDVEPGVLDAGLIAAGQKVEHYEMAAYGCAHAWAKRLGLDEAVRLLTATFDEEKATDEKLTQLAEQSVNAEAEEGDQEEKKASGDSRGQAKTRSSK